MSMPLIDQDAKQFVKLGMIPDEAIALGDALVETLIKTEKPFELHVTIDTARPVRATMMIASKTAHLEMVLKPDGTWFISRLDLYGPFQ